MPEVIKLKQVQKQELSFDNLKKLAGFGGCSDADFAPKRALLEAKLQTRAEPTWTGEKARMRSNEVAESDQFSVKSLADKESTYNSAAPAPPAVLPVPVSSVESDAPARDESTYSSAMKGDIGAPTLQGATNGTIGPQQEEIWSKDSFSSAGSASSGCESSQFWEGKRSSFNATQNNSFSPQVGYTRANTFFNYLAFCIVLAAAFVMFIVFKVASLAGRDSLDTRAR